jgi:hypothetical protein
MRISPSQTLAGLGALSGLVLIIALALVQPSHGAPAPVKAAPAKAACPTTAAPRKTRIKAVHKASRRHGALIRTHAWRNRVGGERHAYWSDRQWSRGAWTGERRWSDEREYGQGRHWRMDGDLVDASGERPWATDRYGYLTWPGKTHFGSAPPPPAPPADGDDGAYMIRRF